MTWYSIEPRTRKYVNRYRFLSIARKYKKQLSDSRFNALKTAFKKIVNKTGEYLGNKIADALVKSNNNKIV